MTAPFPPAPPPPTVAILGGGLSGAAVAYHLVRSGARARILVIEPRPRLGAGLAYSAEDPDHRLNVPDVKMTLRTDIPDHYARWLREGHPPPQGSVAPGGDIFTPRRLFADYVADQLAPALQQGRIGHLRQRAEGVEEKDGRYLVALSDGTRVTADVLVLALSHPKPFLPPELAPLARDPRLIADPLAPGALEQIGPADRLAIVGNGLTASDVLATLRRRGFRGRILALSRHGLRPMPHGPSQAETQADFATDPAATALALLRRIRAALAVDTAQGLTWHAVFDRLRAQGPAIWAALPEAERLRLLRHLRSLWDVHRFRIAPQTAAAAATFAAEGRLETLAARLVWVKVGPEIVLAFRPRGATGLRQERLDRIVLATGPHHASVLQATPVLAALARLGLIGADRTRLGIATAPSGLAIPPKGPPGRIFVAGPLARGTVGELMGVPEVISWAEHVAAGVAGLLASGAARWLAAG